MSTGRPLQCTDDDGDAERSFDAQQNNAKQHDPSAGTDHNIEPNSVQSNTKRPLGFDRKLSSASLLPKVAAPSISTSKRNSYNNNNAHNANANASFASGPTTAITLENASNFDSMANHPASTAASISGNSIRFHTHTSSDANSVYSPRLNAVAGSCNAEGSEEHIDELDDDHDLSNILHDLMIHEQHTLLKKPPASASKRNGRTTFLDWNIFNTDNPHVDGANENISESQSQKREVEFLKQYIAINKSNDPKAFHHKLKHFFILSTAGKPIYSMNGSDEIIMGYMGLITTIVATFEENMKEDFKSITYGDNLKLSVLNKDPILFVSITKIDYEMMISANDSDRDEDRFLNKQLGYLHTYLLSILSKPTITKNFHNRMNYDLRKILTPLDFHNLDELCMKLTYGLSLKEAEAEEDNKTITVRYDSGFELFVSQLLDSCLQSVYITNTTRTKLNSILLSCKKLKAKKSGDDDISDAASFASPSTLTEKERDQERYLGSDLLFSLLTTEPGNKPLSIMRPRNHQLSNDDIQTLLFMTQFSPPVSPSSSTDIDPPQEGQNEDLWIPLCMPQFNSNGFLYVFVKRFDLAEFVLVDGNRVAHPQWISIILVSGNKNSFFAMQQVAQHIISKITSNETFRNRLSNELLQSHQISVLKEIEQPVVKHFIYKSKLHNQFFVSDINDFASSSKQEDEDVVPRRHQDNPDLIVQLVYFYSMLYKTKSSIIKPVSIFADKQGKNIEVTSQANRDDESAKRGTDPDDEHGSKVKHGLSNQVKNNNKKLTYMKWYLSDEQTVTGFMLSDQDYEFYCLCNAMVPSQHLINHSLRIIKWIERYHKRLFIREGAIF